MERQEKAPCSASVGAVGLQAYESAYRRPTEHTLVQAPLQRRRSVLTALFRSRTQFADGYGYKRQEGVRT